MNMLYEGLKGGQSTIVIVPSTALNTMILGDTTGTIALAKMISKEKKEVRAEPGIRPRNRGLFVISREFFPDARENVPCKKFRNNSSLFVLRSGGGEEYDSSTETFRLVCPGNLSGREQIQKTRN